MQAQLQVSIRLALPDDGPQILVMLKSLATFERAPRPPQLNLASLENDVFAATPTLRIFVAEGEANHLLGCITYYENYSTWEGRAGIHICDLWVEPEARGQGIGAALIHHVVSLHRSQRIDLFVLRNNKARNFYEHMGFSEQQGWCIYRKDPE